MVKSFQLYRSSIFLLSALFVILSPAAAQEEQDTKEREEQDRAFLERQQASLPAQIEAESRYYKLLTMPLLDDMVMEVSGLLKLADGRIMVATRRGEVFIVENTDTDPPAPVYKRYAFGLAQPLGLLELDGWIYFAQRGELSRMRDSDGNDTADVFETVTDDWELSGNYPRIRLRPKTDCGRQALGFAEHPFRQAALRRCRLAGVGCAGGSQNRRDGIRRRGLALALGNRSEPVGRRLLLRQPGRVEQRFEALADRGR